MVYCMESGEKQNAFLTSLNLLYDYGNVPRHLVNLLCFIMKKLREVWSARFPSGRRNPILPFILNSMLCIGYFGLLLLYVPFFLFDSLFDSDPELVKYFSGLSLYFVITLSSFDCMIYLRRYLLLIPLLLLTNRRERAVILRKRPESGWGKFKPYAPASQRLLFSSKKSPIEACWLHDVDEDRDMVLLNSLQFVDSRNYSWVAKKGLIIDGATIPKLFWNTIGPPYVGTYRNASVVHDAYCEDHVRTGEQAWWAKLHHRDSHAVHQMFYEAMRADHERYRAKNNNPFARCNEWVLDVIIYLTVSIFGPRWK